MEALTERMHTGVRATGGVYSTRPLEDAPHSFLHAILHRTSVRLALPAPPRSTIVRASEKEARHDLCQSEKTRSLPCSCRTRQAHRRSIGSRRKLHRRRIRSHHPHRSSPGHRRSPCHPTSNRCRSTRRRRQGIPHCPLLHRHRPRPAPGEPAHQLPSRT